MPRRILMERDRQPDGPAFRASVGAAAPLWIELDRLLVEAVGAHGVCAWGGRSYGWEMRYARAGRPLTSLAPLGEGFTAQVVLGPALLELKLPARARAALDAQVPVRAA